MRTHLYNNAYQNYFTKIDFEQQIELGIKLVEEANNIFFIGNGGSNSVCSHMMEDFAKIANKPSFAFSDAALITCFSNDYGYDNAMMEWLKIYFKKGDLLVAISSSGKSNNILNAVDYVQTISDAKIITLSGFDVSNPLKGKGNLNFHIENSSYGIVECFHQIILHIIVDYFDSRLK
jgi:D-sedoheptulose 7-phosphate isomerase